MDKWLKVDFSYAGDLLVPPALTPEFHKLLRGCEIVKMEYDPREGNHSKHAVEGRVPSIAFVDDPGTPLTEEQWETMKEELLDAQAEASGGPEESDA